MNDAKEFLESSVSRETFRALELYVQRITKWNPRINLISKNTLSDIWNRHIADSHQIAGLAPPTVKTWVDLGSGGGLPGLVISILRPETKVTLIESDQRKSVFLSTVIHELNLNATVETRRIEAKANHYDLVSARALASITDLLSLAEPYCAPHTTCLFMKGASYGEELSKASQFWRIQYEVIPSSTQPGSAVIRVREYSRV